MPLILDKPIDPTVFKGNREKMLSFYIDSSTNKMDFKKITSQPILVRNILLTGIILMNSMFYEIKTYEHSNDDFLIFIYYRIQSINKEFIGALSHIAKHVFKSAKLEIVSDNLPTEILKRFNDPEGVLINHYDSLAKHVGIEGDYTPQDFMVIPSYSSNPWGPCIWALRMFVIYNQKGWELSHSLNHAAMFIKESVLLLPCIFCVINVIADESKSLTLQTIFDFMKKNHNEVTTTLMGLECAFHMMVSNSINVIDNKNVSIPAYVDMYLEMFNNLLDF